MKRNRLKKILLFIFICKQIKVAAMRKMLVVVLAVIFSFQNLYSQKGDNSADHN
jgi:hypothetical protein